MPPWTIRCLGNRSGNVSRMLAVHRVEDSFALPQMDARVPDFDNQRERPSVTALKSTTSELEVAQVPAQESNPPEYAASQSYPDGIDFCRRRTLAGNDRLAPQVTWWCDSH